MIMLQPRSAVRTHEQPRSKLTNEIMPGDQAAVEAAQQAAEQVALGGGVPVAVVAAAVVVGAGAG
jgi:hypothetical protein